MSWYDAEVFLIIGNKVKAKPLRLFSPRNMQGLKIFPCAPPSNQFPTLMRHHLSWWLVAPHSRIRCGEVNVSKPGGSTEGTELLERAPGASANWMHMAHYSRSKMPAVATEAMMSWNNWVFFFTVFDKAESMGISEVYAILCYFLLFLEKPNTASTLKPSRGQRQVSSLGKGSQQHNKLEKSGNLA